MTRIYPATSVDVRPRVKEHQFSSYTKFLTHPGITSISINLELDYYTNP